MTAYKMSRKQILFWAIVVEGGLALVALAGGWLIGYPSWHYMRFEWSALFRGILVTLPMGACLVLFLCFPVGPLARIRDIVDEIVVPMFADCRALELAIIAVSAGIGEELFFRAFLQSVLGDWTTPLAGIAVTSCLFGLLHFITPTYALLAAAAGAYLGGVFYLTENVLDVVIAHALYDFAALLWIMNQKTRMPEDSTNGDEEMEAT